MGGISVIVYLYSIQDAPVAGQAVDRVGIVICQFGLAHACSHLKHLLGSAPIAGRGEQQTE